MTSEPSQPEEAAQRGKDLYQSGDFSGAAQAFSDAVELFQQQADDLKAAEMANNQAVSLLQLERANAAIEVLQGTPQIFEESNELSLAAQAHGNLGQALAEAGQREQAQDHYRQAINLFEQLDDRENLQHTARALSQLQLNQGDAISALFSMQRGLEGSQPSSWRDRFLRWLLRLPSRFLSR